MLVLHLPSLSDVSVKNEFLTLNLKLILDFLIVFYFFSFTFRSLITHI